MPHFVHIAVPAEVGGGILTMHSDNFLTVKDVKDRGLSQPNNKRVRRISIDVNPKDFGVSMDVLPPHTVLSDSARLADDSTVYIVRLSSQEIEVAGLQTISGTYLACTKNGGPVGTSATLSALTMWSVAAGKSSSLLLRDADGLYLASDSQGKVFTAPLQLMAWGQAHWTVEESRYLKSAYDKYLVVSDGLAYCRETCEPASVLTRAGTIMFEGWLKIKSQRKISLSKFYDRYFVVNNGKLSYYNNQARHAEGVMEKQFSIQDIVTVGSDKEDPCCFTITFTAHVGVVLTLVAHSVDIADSWISVLRDERDAHSSLASFFQTQRMLKFDRKSSQKSLPLIRVAPEVAQTPQKRGSFSGSFDLSAPGNFLLDSPLALFPEPSAAAEFRDLPDDIGGLRARAQEILRHNHSMRTHLTLIDNLLVDNQHAVTRLDACLNMVQCFPSTDIPDEHVDAERLELLELTSDLSFLEQKHSRLTTEAHALRSKVWELRNMNQGGAGVVSLADSDEESDIDLVLVHL